MKKEMEARYVWKNRASVTFLFLLFIRINSFGQTKKEIYFLIDKQDTLIKKQTATKGNQVEGYLIIAEARTKPLKITPVEEGKVWVPESDDDNSIPGHWFQFLRKNDKLITEEELAKLDVIRERKEFLNMEKVPFDLSGKTYFFIEPQSCSDKYILREVFPLVFE